MLLVETGIVAARWPACVEEVAAIDAAMAGFHSWGGLHAAMLRFEGCDDGAIAEGYSDSVAKLLADHWERLSDLRELIEVDPFFQRFVVSHIDATADDRDLARIVVAAKERCPENVKALCDEIGAAAERAWSDVLFP